MIHALIPTLTLLAIFLCANSVNAQEDGYGYRDAYFDRRQEANFLQSLIPGVTQDPSVFYAGGAGESEFPSIGCWEPCHPGLLQKGWPVARTDDPVESEKFLKLCEFTLSRKVLSNATKFDKRQRLQLITPSKNVSLTVRLLRTYYVAYREQIAYEHAPPLPDVSRGKSKGPRNILVALIGEEELAKLDDWLKNESRYLLIPCTATLTFTDNDFHQMLKAMKITL